MQCFRQNGASALQCGRVVLSRPVITASRSRLSPRPGLLLHTLSSPTTSSRYPATRAQLQLQHAPSRSRPSPPHPSRLSLAPPARYCSHRRNMCRHFGVDDQSSMDVSKGREVLPANVKPVHYDLTLEPDFDKFTYNGTVTIEYAGPLLQRMRPPADTLPV
jgi:aminopeptidase 2